METQITLLKSLQEKLCCLNEKIADQNTLLEPQPIVFKNFASDGVGTVDVVIPPSLWWKAELKSGSGVTSAGGNTIDEYEPTGSGVRADGQAHPAVTLTIPNAPVDTVVLRVNYEPIA